MLSYKNKINFIIYFSRYTAKTFSRALSLAQPDVIAFLGDLMDEGHIATNKDFLKYKQRFDSIFYTPEHIMVINKKYIQNKFIV